MLSSISRLMAWVPEVLARPRHTHPLAEEGSRRVRRGIHRVKIKVVGGSAPPTGTAPGRPQLNARATDSPGNSDDKLLRRSPQSFTRPSGVFSRWNGQEMKAV